MDIKKNIILIIKILNYLEYVIMTNIYIEYNNNMNKSNINQNQYLSFNPWQKMRDMEKAF